jgi:transketolase
MENLRDVFMNELIAYAAKDPRIVVLDPDVGEATRTWNFGERYPDRFYEFGIAEQNTFGVASGLASTGCVVFASTFAVFASMRAAEMVRTSICYPRRNVKVIGGYAGISNGKDGATHQSLEDVAIMRSFAGLVVVVPSDPVIARKLVAPLCEYAGPVYVRMEYETLPAIYLESQTFEIGKGYVVRKGKDVTIASYGTALHRTLAAAKTLEAEGINAEVLDFPTLKPFDSAALLASIGRTKALVTVEDHSVIGGLKSIAGECVLDAGITVGYRGLGIADLYTESGKTDELRCQYGIDAGAVVKAAREIVRGKR